MTDDTRPFGFEDDDDASAIRRHDEIRSRTRELLRIFGRPEHGHSEAWVREYVAEKPIYGIPMDEWEIEEEATFIANLSDEVPVRQTRAGSISKDEWKVEMFDWREHHMDMTKEGKKERQAWDVAMYIFHRADHDTGRNIFMDQKFRDEMMARVLRLDPSNESDRNYFSKVLMTGCNRGFFDWQQKANNRRRRGPTFGILDLAWPNPLKSKREARKGRGSGTQRGPDGRFVKKESEPADAAQGELTDSGLRP